jgi:uncharacterized coiled-coil DUF342 family protein
MAFGFGPKLLDQYRLLEESARLSTRTRKVGQTLMDVCRKKETLEGKGEQRNLRTVKSSRLLVTICDLNERLRTAHSILVTETDSSSQGLIWP